MLQTKCFFSCKIQGLTRIKAENIRHYQTRIALITHYKKGITLLILLYKKDKIGHYKKGESKTIHTRVRDTHFLNLLLVLLYKPLKLCQKFYNRLRMGKILKMWIKTY